MSLEITPNPRKIAIILAGIAIALAALSIGAKAYEWSLPVNGSNYFIFNFVRTVNINREESLPTWYSTLLLAIAATLALLIACTSHHYRRPLKLYWLSLGILFLYLSLDEAAAIHEKFTIPMQEEFELEEYFYFGWVLVGAPFALAMSLLYSRFIFRLERRTRWLVLLAGALYIGGSLVIESLSARLWDIKEGTSLEYSAIGTVEELFEMLGVIVFIYALLDYIQQHIPVIVIQGGGRKAKPSDDCV